MNESKTVEDRRMQITLHQELCECGRESEIVCEECAKLEEEYQDLRFSDPDDPWPVVHPRNIPVSFDALREEYEALIGRDDYSPLPVQPKGWASTPVSALDEAHHIVYGQRRADYGHPLDNHSRTAAFWSTFLGIPITAEQVCWMNILQKIARSMNSEKRDTVVDTIGYAANIDMIKLEREARER